MTLSFHVETCPLDKQIDIGYTPAIYMEEKIIMGILIKNISLGLVMALSSSLAMAGDQTTTEKVVSGKSLIQAQTSAFDQQNNSMIENKTIVDHLIDKNTAIDGVNILVIHTQVVKKPAMIDVGGITVTSEKTVSSGTERNPITTAEKTTRPAMESYPVISQQNIGSNVFAQFALVKDGNGQLDINIQNDRINELVETDAKSKKEDTKPNIKPIEVDNYLAFTDREKRLTVPDKQLLKNKKLRRG